MKKVMVFVMLFLFSSVLAFGRNRSTIRFRLKNGNLIRVALNNRYFNKTAHAITVGDIPGKHQKVKVYQFKPYTNKRGGKATLVFSGRINIEKGETYDAVIDAKTGKLYLTKVSQLTKIQKTPLPPPEKNTTLNISPNNSDTALTTPKPDVATKVKPLSPELRQLKSKIDKQVTDPMKLRKALLYVNGQKSISAESLYSITSWLLFDANKIRLVKAAYRKVNDKQNLGKIQNLLTTNDSKKDFNKFLQSKK